MKKLFFVACILLSTKIFALELTKYPIELSSAEGINVVIATTLDKKQALVRVKGINNEIDDIVFLTNLEPHGSNKAYKYTFDGSKRSIVTVNDNYRCCSYTLNIPDSRDGVYLRKNEESTSGITESLEKQYEQQVSKEIQAKLAIFNRDKHLNYQQMNMTDADQQVNKQCGSTIKTNVDWEAVDDKSLQKYAVGSFCAQVAKEIAYMCKEDNSFKSKIADVSTINCEFTDQLKLRKLDKTLTFKTSSEAPNQGRFIKAYLLNL
ncbi:hypothetical protein I6F65_17775 [Pseudoalteromonas sp. SWXJZ94C]|uniref:hypothetical protein n=1 Tax=unclassified Pseudoalteromonas TaxID=194690 RepID=UPI00140DA0F0|nr:MULTISPECIES: hypothetical protein [unclassified Pseudoalteromonas]MBH0058796.1 hypothetical protein [Pseudoalteromonas sp. SWXJZ94C]